MQPVSRIAMRFGYSAREVSDVTRWSFVHSFFSTPEFWRLGRPTVLQGAVKTGLARQQVNNLRQLKSPDDAIFSSRQNLAYRVIEGWMNDPLYQQDGKPMVLPLKHRPGPTLNKLVMHYGMNTTTGAALGDLVMVGCVELNDGMVTLVNPTYGANAFDQDKLELAGFILCKIAETFDHNLMHRESSERRVQRVWRQVLVPASKMTEARRLVSEMAIVAGREIDAELSKLAHASPQEGQRYEEIGVIMSVHENETNVDNLPEDGLTRRSTI